MKKHTESLKPDTFYHIYNRGINGTDIFIENRNYHFFLKKYAFHISPVADTYAYCLMKNHFHLLIKTKTEENVVVNNVYRVVINSVDVKNDVHNRVDAGKIISRKFANLFNSYSQAINKAYGRTGGLFETPFRRIPVEDEAYFCQLVFYTHFNPQKHGFAKDFRTYEYFVLGQSHKLQ